MLDVVLQGSYSCLSHCSLMLPCRYGAPERMSESWLQILTAPSNASFHVAGCSAQFHGVSLLKVIEQLTKSCFHSATGFMQQFAAVSSMAKPDENLAEVINQLSGGQDPNRVLCCGHSLGGALATLGEPCHTVPRERPI